jgi:succinyl-CoA synthetase beta subunit
MVVVKAQCTRRPRKAGGVKLAKTPAEAKEIASKILGMKINGLTVYTVLVTARRHRDEAYVGIILDARPRSRCSW